MTTLTLVLTAVGSVLLLLFLVMKARMHAFLALMVVSMGAGLFSGMPLDKIAATMEKGMGGTLGFLAVVVILNMIGLVFMCRQVKDLQTEYYNTPGMYYLADKAAKEAKKAKKAAK